MKNWWLKLGCFLTGYNYQIVSHSSEVSVKAVKKYTSAIVIVCMLWAFIGYFFADRYLKTDLFGSVIGAIIAIIFVVQIERQIILSVGKNKMGKWFRVLIGLLMAGIGSVIIDQMIFKDDIEKEKITHNETLINSYLPKKTAELVSQIRMNDSLITSKEAERLAIQQELTRTPTIALPSSNITYTKDSLGNLRQASKINTVNSMPNPKANLLAPLQDQLNTYIKRKTELEDRLLKVREVVEMEVNSKTGFLDELNILFSIINESVIALAIWLLWFILLFAIELFVLVSKFGDITHDYEETVLHQMNVRLEMLKKLKVHPNTNG